MSDISEASMATIVAKIETAVATSVGNAIISTDRKIALLEDKIASLLSRFDTQRIEYDEKISSMSTNYDNKIRHLNDHIDRLTSRHDDQEMRSRRYNVRIENIPFSVEPKDETPEILQAAVVSQCEEMNIHLEPADIVRLHRSSRPSTKDGLTSAQTIIRLASWAKRKQFCKVNKIARAKKSNFRAHNDLTKARHDLLSYARGRIDRAMHTKFSERELKKGVKDNDNCFTFATADGQLLLRCNSEVFPYTSSEEFDDLFREHFVTTRPQRRSNRLNNIDEASDDEEVSETESSPPANA